MTADFKGDYYAKVEAFNPGHSSKDRIALYIIARQDKLYLHDISFADGN